MICGYVIKIPKKIIHLESKILLFVQLAYVFEKILYTYWLYMLWLYDRRKHKREEDRQNDKHSTK